jgi:phosphoserine aminotransferase
MNAVFFLKDQTKEAAFLNLCKENGMIGVKGYRTVGGIRVSMYNAMSMSSVVAFCDLMKGFH